MKTLIVYSCGIAWASIMVLTVSCRKASTSSTASNGAQPSQIQSPATAARITFIKTMTIDHAVRWTQDGINRTYISVSAEVPAENPNEDPIYGDRAFYIEGRRLFEQWEVAEDTTHDWAANISIVTTHFRLWDFSSPWKVADLEIEVAQDVHSKDKLVQVRLVDPLTVTVRPEAKQFKSKQFQAALLNADEKQAIHAALIATVDPTSKVDMTGNRYFPFESVTWLDGAFLPSNLILLDDDASLVQISAERFPGTSINDAFPILATPSSALSSPWIGGGPIFGNALTLPFKGSVQVPETLFSSAMAESDFGPEPKLVSKRITIDKNDGGTISIKSRNLDINPFDYAREALFSSKYRFVNPPNLWVYGYRVNSHAVSWSYYQEPGSLVPSANNVSQFGTKVFPTLNKVSVTINSSLPGIDIDPGWTRVWTGTELLQVHSALYGFDKEGRSRLARRLGRIKAIYPQEMVVSGHRLPRTR